MCRMINVVANDNYTITIEFEQENSITYNMKNNLKTIPFIKLNDMTRFKKVKFDEKSIYWEEENDEKSIIPFRLSIDTILFSLRK